MDCCNQPAKLPLQSVTQGSLTDQERQSRWKVKQRFNPKYGFLWGAEGRSALNARTG
jgi:hypothetical protein